MTFDKESRHLRKKANGFRLQLRRERFKFILLVKPYIIVARYLTYVKRTWFDYTCGCITES